ncbi:ankyrin repeat-containing protein [Legionella santicrucis]|uniref:Ankyrin repeat-containing protein n=1 Tax=Legionella santicrucis TaxID=45074 RepID=A0A0W0YRN7_9GAMM|nr:hypothetical protein [Legionella santicrucis]KTD59310.1 ankyrin repeat-containing protein [Legionella santicrucis]
MPRDNVNTEQYLVIRNLNNYLKYHNLPLKVGEDGICHALSTLYIQYTLEGKEKEFEKLLSFIAQKTPVGSNEFPDAELFILVEKIIALQEGKSTRNKYSQSNSHEQLQVNGQNLGSVFQIGLKTNLDNWAQIVRDINLRDNEVMRVSTLQHTIAIARDESGGYKVYDPNNSKINQKFDNEREMVQWLSKEAFNFSLVSSGTLDMNISVISHEPSPIDRNFPSKNDLLDQYLTPEQKKIDSKLGGGLHFAMKFDDAEAAEYILNDSGLNLTHLGDDEVRCIALCAIVRDSANALGELIDILENEKKDILDAAFRYALSSGSARCIGRFLENDHIQRLYNNCIELNYAETAKRVFQGMNEQLIDKVVNDVLEKRGQEVFTPQLVAELIKISIEKQNSHAISLLAKKIANFDQIISSNDCLEFLKVAIENNDPLMVRALITNLNIKEEKLNCLNMGLSVINKYNVEIFTTLQEKGYEFTPQAAELIESKKTQGIGILKSLGIALIRFSEFLTNQNKIQVDNDKVSQFSPREVSDNDEKNITPIEDNSGFPKHQIIFATDDESEEDELKSDAQSLKQNVHVFKEFKEKLYSIISSSREAETKTETKESSFNVTP